MICLTSVFVFFFVYFCCSGTGRQVGAVAPTSALAEAQDTEDDAAQAAADGARRTNDDDIAAARARYLARKQARAKGSRQ